MTPTVTRDLKPVILLSLWASISSGDSPSISHFLAKVIPWHIVMSGGGIASSTKVGLSVSIQQRSLSFHCKLVTWVDRKVKESDSLIKPGFSRFSSSPNQRLMCLYVGQYILGGSRLLLVVGGACLFLYQSCRNNSVMLASGMCTKSRRLRSKDDLLPLVSSISRWRIPEEMVMTSTW